MSHVHAFPMHTYFFSIYLIYLKMFETFLIVFLFLPLCCLRQSCLWHLSVNPLQPGTLFVPEIHHHLILHYLIFGSVMMMPLRHFRRTFLDEAFIRNAKSSCQILLTPTFLLSFTVGDGSHCVTSQSHVLSCLSRIFTPT